MQRLAMDIPLEIHFHGIDKSKAVEDRVREKVAKLAKHFGRMTSCRVVLEAPHRNPQKAKVYQIKIEIGVPSRRPIVVSHEREGSHAAEELNLALRDAFEAALRKVDGVASKIGERSKLERGRRRPAPGG
jgi:ribosome-associated translation inhibitor RaiA